MTEFDFEQRLESIEGYRKILLASSEQGGDGDFEYLERQIDSFSDDRAKMTQLCRDIDELKRERKSLIKLYDELKLRKEELSQLEERHKQLSAPLQYSDSKEKKLFDKCMGLEFRLTEDHAVSLVYTSLHPDDAERRFIITLDIDEDDQDKWKVMNMDPVIHGVRPLIDELNESGNFSQFCKKVRQKFQELAIKQTST